MLACACACTRAAISIGASRSFAAKNTADAATDSRERALACLPRRSMAKDRRDATSATADCLRRITEWDTYGSISRDRVSIDTHKLQTALAKQTYAPSIRHILRMQDATSSATKGDTPRIEAEVALEPIESSTDTTMRVAMPTLSLCLFKSKVKKFHLMNHRNDFDYSSTGATKRSEIDRSLHCSTWRIHRRCIESILSSRF